MKLVLVISNSHANANMTTKSLLKKRGETRGCWTKRRHLIGACLIFIVLSAAASAQAPGQTPPRELVAEAKPILRDIEEALQSKDALSVRRGVKRVQEVLGGWAGQT